MRKSRLSKYKQSRLIELFVAGTTARTAASLVGVNKTQPATIFSAYVNSFMIGANTLNYWREKLKLMKVILVVVAKVNEVVEQRVKSPYLAS